MTFLLQLFILAYINYFYFEHDVEQLFDWGREGQHRAVGLQWVQQEHGGRGESISLSAELSYLYSLGRSLFNTGAFSFIPKPSQDYSDWKFGNIHITASSKPDGARFLWLISRILEKKSHLVFFVEIFFTLIFQADYSCDIERSSVCTYHPGSVHCVRAIQAR